MSNSSTLAEQAWAESSRSSRGKGGGGRLLRRTFLIALILVSGGLIAGSAIELFFRYRESIDLIGALQREMAQGAAFKIHQFVRDIEKTVRVATQTQTLVNRGLTKAYRFDLIKLLKATPAIAEASVLDLSGRELINLSRVKMGLEENLQDRSSEEAFVRARGGSSYYGQVYFVRDSEPYMTLAVPIERYAGEVLGVLIAQVNLKYIWDVVSDIKAGREGYTYVVSGTGDLIAHPNISLVLEKRNLKNLHQVQAALTGAANQLRPQRNLVGQEVFSAYALIPDLGWAVFVERPVSEAYAPIYASMLRTSVLLLVGLGIALLASFLIRRRVVRPVEMLRAGAARIGRGDLDHRLEVKTGDELEALGEAFNKMASELQESYAGLEQKVAVRTQELSVANERLKELDRLKSDFVSNVSHELRTPLTAIKGAVDLVLREVAGPLTEKQIHYLTRVRSNTQHLAGLINDLLDLSKIESGKIEMKSSRVSLGGLLHEVIETLRPVAAEKAIALDATTPEPSIMVWADRDKINQVLMNLIGNAIKFTPAHGTVTVSASRNGNDRVQVSVSDTGPGVPLDQREKIFDKFYQNADLEGAKPKGTGLGLAICKALVELHGGRIWVESEMNRGSKFCFTLAASGPLSSAAG